jgi:hypothetical protein
VEKYQCTTTPDVVTRACVDMASLPETGVHEGDACRVERSGGRVVCATFDLGSGVRLGYDGRAAWLDVPCDLPAIARLAITGHGASRAVEHPWVIGSVIARAEERDGRTRLLLADLQPSDASQRSLAVI